MPERWWWWWRDLNKTPTIKYLLARASVWSSGDNLIRGLGHCSAARSVNSSAALCSTAAQWHGIWSQWVVITRSPRFDSALVLARLEWVWARSCGCKCPELRVMSRLEYLTQNCWPTFSHSKFYTSVAHCTQVWRRHLRYLRWVAIIKIIWC